MTSIVVPIGHQHDFEAYERKSTENVHDDDDDGDCDYNNEQPTNDSVDEEESQFPLSALFENDTDADTNTNSDTPMNNDDDDDDYVTSNAYDNDNDDGDNDDANEIDNDATMNDFATTTTTATTTITTNTITINELTKQPGGLRNMGNTCYLNSALQMLASLDEFGDRIKVPCAHTTSKLRESLLDVLTRLRNGETVRPDEFKSVIDERSPLFIGYRQQDSHEFLTTLLDLLDEDYKKKEEQEPEPEPEPEPQPEIEQEQEEQTEGPAIIQDEDNEQQEPSEAQTEADEVMEDAVSEEQEATDQSESADMVTEVREIQSPVKRQKIVDTSDDEQSTISSFKDLQFSDIETLLHGERAVTPPPLSPSKDKAPKCKLIGGRMSTSGVNLIPLEDGTSSPEETSTPSKTDDEEAATPLDNDQSPIDTCFATEVRVCLTCDSCKYRRSHTEKYLHLSLEIGDSCSSIEDGLRKFFAPEKRELKCEKCFCETAMQTTEITKLPRAMLFHLKRFIVNISPDYTSISYNKDQSAVSFEESLPFGEDSILSEFLAADVSLPEGGISYGIRSVVNHIGSSASCGHYTADARRRYSGGREWTRFNDSIVSRISDRTAVHDSERTAYMIMYEMGA